MFDIVSGITPPLILGWKKCNKLKGVLPRVCSPEHISYNSSYMLYFNIFHLIKNYFICLPLVCLMFVKFYLNYTITIFNYKRFGPGNKVELLNQLRNKSIQGRYQSSRPLRKTLKRNDCAFCVLREWRSFCRMWFYEMIEITINKLCTFNIYFFFGNSESMWSSSLVSFPVVWASACAWRIMKYQFLKCMSIFSLRILLFHGEEL